METIPKLTLTVVGTSSGRSIAAIWAELPCDEHGVHKIEERFDVPPNYTATAEGVWLAYVLAVVADRYCPKGQS